MELLSAYLLPFSGRATPLAEAATSLQQIRVTGSQLDTKKEELKNMNREECREILSLACLDYRYFRRHRRSFLAVFQALHRIPGTISEIQRRRVLAVEVGATSVESRPRL